jgi:hypothetical protein
MKIQGVDHLDRESEKLGFGAAEFLRSRGWQYTSNTPGRVWLWRKQIGADWFLVGERTALGIERAQDRLLCKCRDLDEDGTVESTDCPLHHGWD